MALQDFILAGSYSVVENIFHNNQTKDLSFDLKIYSDSSKSSPISSMSYQISALNNSKNYAEVIAIDQTDPTLVGGSEGDKWLVAAGAVGEWASHDGQVALKGDGDWFFIDMRISAKIKNIADGLYYARTIGGWVLISSSSVNEYVWDAFFETAVMDAINSNIVKQSYEWLKTKPEFSGVIDV